MKIKVWEGTTLNEATLNLVKSIDNLDMKVEHLVVVPDSFSLLMERLLLKTLPHKSMFNVSVLGLSGLALRLLDEIGLGKVEMLSTADALLATSQAIKNKLNEFEIFKKSNINFCYEVYKVISQLQSSGVKPKQLFLKTGSAFQQRKYHDIGLIYEEYERLIQGKLDASGLLDYFNTSLANSEALKNKKFYFAHFDSFTHKGFEVIKTLARLGEEVNISLCTPLSEANAYIYEKDIMEKLRVLAKELGAVIEVEKPQVTLNQNANLIASNLFALSTKNIRKESDDFFNCLSCCSVPAECELLGKMIRYRVVKGARYKDFVIACGDLEKYSEHFERVLSCLDIPYFIDKSQTAEKTLLSNFIFRIINVLAKDYSAESLQELISDPVFSEAEAEGLCGYITSHNIKGKARYKKYFVQFLPRLEKVLLQVEKIENYEQMCEFCLGLIEEYQENYVALLQTLKNQNLVKEYNINIQIRDILVDTLQKLASYKRQEACSASEFLKELKLLLSFKEVSSVPTYVDAVMIGDATSSYFGQVENLIIVGGERLPLISGDNGLISDEDIDKLSVVRRIEPSIRMINRRNRFKLFNLLCSAKSSLIVSFQEVNEEGKRVEMPTYIEGLLDLFGQQVLRQSSFSQFLGYDAELDMQKLLFFSGNRKMAIENGLIDCDLTKSLNRKSLEIDAKQFFFNKGYTGVTQLECYFSCPFKHFIRYGLRAKEPEEYTFDPRDIGNVCHRLAQMFVEKYKTHLGGLVEREVLSFVDENLTKALSYEGLEDKLSVTEDRAGALDFMHRSAVLLLSRICEEQRYSHFRPYLTEFSVDDEFSMGEEKLKLIGKIDRIDVCDNNFRILDYKTGKIAPLLKDLYYGDKLQLFLYERATGRKLNLSSAGAFYFDARFDYESESTQDSLLKGLVINDADILISFDYRLQEGKSGIIAVAPKAGGGFKGSVLAKYPLEVFENYAREVSCQALQEISKGYIEPKPDAQACEKCKFRSICLFDKQSGYRKKETVTQEDIARVMEVKNA